MLKKEIKYSDLSGNEVSEDYYFNLNKAELMELLVSEEGGFDEYLKRIAEAGDNRVILAELKKIVLLSIGNVSPDGKRFIKNQDIRDAFVETEAYSELLMWFFEDGGNNNAADFVNAIVSPGVRKAVEEAKQIESGKPVETVEIKTAEDLLALDRDLTPKELAGFNDGELARAFKMKMERDAAK